MEPPPAHAGHVLAEADRIDADSADADSPPNGVPPSIDATRLRVAIARLSRRLATMSWPG